MVREVSDRKLQVELENQKLAAELRLISSSRAADSLNLDVRRNADDLKALQVAESRVNALERQVCGVHREDIEV